MVIKLTVGAVGSNEQGEVGGIVEPSGKLWCDVVNNRGNTGWHVISLTRKRWPDVLEAWPILSTCNQAKNI